jgi:hypothetical protein
MNSRGRSPIDPQRGDCTQQLRERSIIIEFKEGKSALNRPGIAAGPEAKNPATVDSTKADSAIANYRFLKCS